MLGGESELHDAAMNGDLESVKRLVTPENINRFRNGPFNPNTVGFTPIAEASMNGHAEVVRFLLDMGARVDSEPEPMRLAYYYGHQDVAREFMRSSLHDAARMGDLHKVKRLVTKRNIDEKRNSPLGLGNTPLAEASGSGHAAVVRFLLDSGASLDSFPSPIQLAKENGFDDVVRMLEAHQNMFDKKRIDLHNAAMMGDLETVKRLVTRENINKTRPGSLNMMGVGPTPLAEASSFGHTAVVRFLLDQGAEVDTYPSPLRLASEGGFEDVMRLLIQKKAGLDVDQPDSHMRTLLHRASCLGEVGIAINLLANGANVDAKDSYGRAPLHEACDNGRLEVVKVLLEHGANVNLKGEDGATPLHLACARNGEIVKLLLAHGAALDLEDDDGLTPFAWTENAEITKILTEHRATEAKRRRRRRKKERTRKQKRDASTPKNEENDSNPEEASAMGRGLPDCMLDLAIMAKAEQWYEWRAKGELSAPKPDPINYRRLGLTPLAEACLNGNTDLVKSLLQSGASVKCNPSPLRLACDGDFIDIVRHLLARGANVNETNQKGWTNLHSACYRGNRNELIDVLLKRGANINQKTHDQNTPLHVACDGGRLDAVDMLLKNGANVNEKGEDGVTPLHIACFRGKEMVKLLLDHGASIDVEDEDGLTPLQAAIDEEIVQILKQHKIKSSSKDTKRHSNKKRNNKKKGGAGK